MILLHERDESDHLVHNLVPLPKVEDFDKPLFHTQQFYIVIATGKELFYKLSIGATLPKDSYDP